MDRILLSSFINRPDVVDKLSRIGILRVKDLYLHTIDTLCLKIGIEVKEWDELFTRKIANQISSQVGESAWDLLQQNGIEQSKSSSSSSSSSSSFRSDSRKRERDSSHISSGVPGLDSLLHGGWRQGSIVDICGRPGTGKTQLCLTTAINTIASAMLRFRGSEGQGEGQVQRQGDSSIFAPPTVVFIDTDKGFQWARVRDMCVQSHPYLFQYTPSTPPTTMDKYEHGDGYQHGIKETDDEFYFKPRSVEDAAQNLKMLLSHIVICTPTTLTELEDTIQQLSYGITGIVPSPIGLIIIDSLASIIRHENLLDAEKTPRLLALASKLHKLGDACGACTLVTNHALDIETRGSGTWSGAGSGIGDGSLLSSCQYDQRLDVQGQTLASNGFYSFDLHTSTAAASATTYDSTGHSRGFDMEMAEKELVYDAYPSMGQSWSICANVRVILSTYGPSEGPGDGRDTPRRLTIQSSVTTGRESLVYVITSLGVMQAVVEGALESERYRVYGN